MDFSICDDEVLCSKSANSKIDVILTSRCTITPREKICNRNKKQTPAELRRCCVCALQGFMADIFIFMCLAALKFYSIAYPNDVGFSEHPVTDTIVGVPPSSALYPLLIHKVQLELLVFKGVDHNPCD